eukprot:3878408-Pleurochrysis_carterae.AAC.1
MCERAHATALSVPANLLSPQRAFARTPFPPPLALCMDPQMELEKEKAEKELKELMARFKLRKSLLHWRHRKLTLSFRALITIVRTRRGPKERSCCD